MLKELLLCLTASVIIVGVFNINLLATPTPTGVEYHVDS